MKRNRTKNNRRKKSQRHHSNLPQAPSPVIEQMGAVLDGNNNSEKVIESNPWFSRKLYLIYGILWLYFIIKIFIVDIEAWLLNWVGLEHYRLFLWLRIYIIPCFIAIAIYWKGYKVVLRHLVHFLLSPLYFTVFLIGEQVYHNLVGRANKRKNATFLVFLLEVLGRVLSKLNYYLFSLLGFSILIICSFYPFDKLIQYAALTVSAVLLVITMYQSVLKAVQPIKIFGYFKIDDIISFSTKGNSKFLKGETSKPKTRAETIQQLLFVYFLTTILHQNISEIRKRKSFLIVSFADFFLLILTVTTLFAFLNYSLFLLSPENFGGKSNPDFGDFAFYSFYSISGEGTSIEPVSRLAMSIKVAITFYGYYLFIFLATILLGFFSEKFAQALESASSFLQQQSKMFEPKLSSMSGISIEILRSLNMANFLRLVNLFNKDKSQTS